MKLRFKKADGTSYPDWATSSLGDHITYKRGGSISKSDLSDQGQPCILYGELYTKYTEIIDKVYSKTLKNMNDSISQKYDIIIPTSGETAEDIALATSCVLLDDIILGGDLMILRPDLNKINGVFLTYYIRSIYKTISPLGQGVSVVHLYWKNLSQLQLPLPSLEEQEKIADFFTALDEKIRLINAQLSQLNLYKQAQLQTIFSPENTANWGTSSLGEVCEIVGGGTPDTSIEEYWGGDILWYTPTEIKSEKYVKSSNRKITALGLKNSSAKLLPVNTILITSRATIGDMAILKEPATTNQGFQSLIVNSANSVEYIYYLQDIIKKELFRLASGSTFLEVNKSSMQTIEIPLPSLEEQAKIADYLSALDDKITNTQQSLEQIKSYKLAMLQKMLGGVR